MQGAGACKDAIKYYVISANVPPMKPFTLQEFGLTARKHVHNLSLAGLMKLPRDKMGFRVDDSIKKRIKKSVRAMPSRVTNSTVKSRVLGGGEEKPKHC